VTRTRLAHDPRHLQTQPTGRDRIRKAFPLADRITYLIAAAVLALTCVAVELAERVGATLSGAL